MKESQIPTAETLHSLLHYASFTSHLSMTMVSDHLRLMCVRPLGKACGSSISRILGNSLCERATHFSPFRRDPERKPKDSSDEGIDDDDSLTISGIEEISSLKILSFNN